MSADALYTDVYEKYTKYINPNLAKLMGFAGFGVEMRAEGCYIYDHEGRQFLDCLGGYGTFTFGHRNPVVIEAVKAQLDQIALSGKAFFTKQQADLAEKLSALRRADFATASGERQRLYFLPYLAMAGWDLSAEGLLPVIPFGVQPAAPPAPPRSDRLIYGGFFLPWQDPTLCLETALDALDAAGRGELIFIGGAHPTADVSRGRFEPLVRRLAAHPRVRMHGPMDFAAYSALLAEGGVALDLMARNAERELAFTTRTAVYLGHGLPVLHDNYSELGEWIAAAGAGWALDPRDRAGVRAVLDSILNNAADLPARGAAAHRLACERLDWNAIAGPLIDFCRNPRRREGKVIGELALESGVRRRREQQAELEHTRGELASLRGKRWVRWGLAATSARAWLRWPAALLALLIAIPLFPVLCLLAFRARKPP